MLKRRIVCFRSPRSEPIRGLLTGISIPQESERERGRKRKREKERGRKIEDGTTTSCPRAVKSAARDADHACESSRIANLPDATPPSLTPDPLSPSSRAFNLTVNFTRRAPGLEETEEIVRTDYRARLNFHERTEASAISRNGLESISDSFNGNAFALRERFFQSLSLSLLLSLSPSSAVNLLCHRASSRFPSFDWRVQRCANPSSTLRQPRGNKREATRALIRGY